MDGTFDQTAPLDRLAGSYGPCFSVDLKSATDTFPVLVNFAILCRLFADDFSYATMVSCLKDILIESL